MTKYIMVDFKDKKIAILGFGIEGQSVADYLIGKTDNLVVLDEKNRSDFDTEVLKSYESRGIDFQFGKIEDLKGFDIVFRSPGFNPASKLITRAKDNGVEISSATKLFFDLCPCPIIGVTGTKGKGTTSTLIYKMLLEEGRDAYLGGNIGESPLSFLESLDSSSKVVLELSSFQLIDMEKSPHIAVMLMTTSEHLDYHKDVHEYVEAKRNIFKFQNENDFAIINQDYRASNESDIVTEAKIYKVSRENKVFSEGCFIQDDKIILKYQKSNTKNQILEKEIITISEIKLPGKHNLENVCAAVMAATLEGVKLDSIQIVLKSFKGLEHRIEEVATINGVKYYDDSFSTTPETAIAAIEAFDEPKILILGGSSKNSDFSELGKIISESNSINAIIGIGLEWKRIKERIKKQESRIKMIEGCKNMHEIVQKAHEIAESGDVVLLSPACASFDMFENYKERGNKFKEEVKALKN